MTRWQRLDAEKIRSHLQTRWLGSQVEVHTTVKSTHDLAAQASAQRTSHGVVVLAEEQVAGRGRGGNRWQGGAGLSVLCSMIVVDSPLSSGLMSLTAAVAVAEALGEQARIKWPNDIMIRGKKICGILLENKVFATHQAFVLGVGINCHQRGDDFPPVLRSLATSLDLESGGYTDRVSLIRRLLVSLEQWLDRAQVEDQTILEHWMQRSMQVGHWVTLQHDGRCYRGQCLGVHPEQGMILQLERGGIRHFDPAQTHVVRESDGRQVIA